MKPIPTRRKHKLARLVAAASGEAVSGDALNARLVKINKALGKKNAVKTLFGEEEPSPVMGWVKTRIWLLDYLIGKFRGVPLGRGLVVWGPESTGKSSFCDYLTLLIQRQGGIGARLDYDDAIDTEILEASGVDPKRLLLPDVATLEDGFDFMAATMDEFYGSRTPKKKKKKGDKPEPEEEKEKKEEKAAPTGPPLIFMWDSIQTSPPKALAMQESADNSYVAVEAKAYAIQLKRFRMLQKGRPVLLVLIGEDRVKIGGMPGWGGPPPNLSGGKAMRHYPTTILRFSGCKLDRVERKGRTVVRGMWVFVTAEKARKGRRGLRGRFFISFSAKNGGPDPVKSNFDFLAENGFIKPRKGQKVIKGLEEEIGPFDQKDFRTILKEHEPKILKMLRAELLKDADPIETDDTPADMDD